MNHLVIKRPDFRFAKDCLNALKKTEIKYLLVQDFFSADEIKSIIKDLRLLPGQLYTKATPGYTVFPRPAFNMVNPAEDVNVYFGASKEAVLNLKKYIGVDVVARFNEVFRQVNNLTPVEVLQGPGGGTTFMPINFRIMTPEIGTKATSHIHNGSNITARCVNGTYKHLTGIVDFENQLSFFCLLQNCAEGGDLTIYDFRREDYPELVDGRYLVNGNNKVDLETTKEKCTVHMEPGDLIVFPGGQLWHRVEVVKKAERISLGGFAASSFADNSWFYWI